MKSEIRQKSKQEIESEIRSEIRSEIGQKLVGGFPGKTMSREFIRLVKEYKIGNVILFRHNVENGEQLKALCESLQALIRKETGHSAFITIDQEGGVVTRLPADGCNVPGAMAIAAGGPPENAALAARITANELKALGINFNLAPSLDINSNPANPVIGVRSYGDTAATVTAYGCAALRGYQKSGILAAVKHFPGHGDTAVDSHVGLPVIDKSWEELMDTQLGPFQAAIAQGTPAVMTSHILFPQLEPDRIPCTMSRQIITGLLREKLGFQGLVLSDCLEMDAIQKYYGTVKGAVAAAAAGVDLIFVSHTAPLLQEAARTIFTAVETGEISREELRESATRIIACKERYADIPYAGFGYGHETIKKQTDELRRKSITLVQGEVFSPGSHSLFVGCYDYRATQASNAESGRTSFPHYMQKCFGGQEIVTGKDPDEKEIAEIATAAHSAEGIFLCTYNGHLMPGQMTLLRELAKLATKMTVIALRNPYDLVGLPPHVTGICAWDYTEATLAILYEVLAGKLIPTGRMPIKL